MDPARIAPELRRAARLAGLVPSDNRLGRAVARGGLALMPAARVEGVALETAALGTAGVRVYRPSTLRSTAALFWIHGGGFVIGRAVQDDRFCGETARELGVVVVSAEYRLAPEHPFPAALDDCLSGWDWLQRVEDRLGIDPARVAVGGESAGGGLAATLVQCLLDRGGTQPAAQWLFCPMLDDRTAGRRDLDAIDHPVWNNRRNRFGWRAYLGAEPGATSVPDHAVSARRAHLTGLPPAWIGAGDIELFYDEDRAYAERLRAAGVEATLDVVTGAPHGFEAIAPGSTLARAYLARARSWLAAELNRGRAQPENTAATIGNAISVTTVASDSVSAT
jgi:acetyl esterase/lipase